MLVIKGWLKLVWLRSMVWLMWWEFWGRLVGDEGVSFLWRELVGGVLVDLVLVLLLGEL